MSKRPMQEATFLILTSLAAGTQHGYGITADVLEISGGRVRLLAGTLYAALDRLRAEGLIEVDREEVVDGRLRRYYRLTQAGGRAMAPPAGGPRAPAPPPPGPPRPGRGGAWTSPPGRGARAARLPRRSPRGCAAHNPR